MDMTKYVTEHGVKNHVQHSCEATCVGETKKKAVVGVECIERSKEKNFYSGKKGCFDCQRRLCTK